MQTLTATPRFTATTQQYEVVGIAQGNTLEIYIDHASTNAPVEQATLEMKLNGVTTPVTLHAEGEFDANLPNNWQSQPLLVALTVNGPLGAEQLTAELGTAQQLVVDTHGKYADEHEHHHQHPLVWAGLGLALLVLGLMIWRFTKRKAKRRNATYTLALPLLLAGLAGHTPPIQAGPGHDHGHDPAELTSPNGNSPKRLPTGEVFLPKPAQRQLQIRTVVAQTTQTAEVVMLNAVVVPDPQSGGVVQTAQGGVFEAPTAGMPQLGQSVRKGQVLGHLRTVQAPLERAAQQAQVAQLQAQIGVAQRRLARLQQLADTVPRKDIDAAQAELQGLQGQIQALQSGMRASEPLLAPVSGQVAASNALAGKVFAPGEVVFEVSNPAVLRMEAHWTATTPPPQFTGAQVQVGGQRVVLQARGTARSLKDQRLALVFETRSLKGANLPTGQLTPVYATTANTQQGVVLPSQAVVKNPANQTVVWVKSQPEQFVPQPVVVQTINGNQVLVSSGLEPEQRVVVQGANLINQVR